MSKKVSIHMFAIKKGKLRDFVIKHQLSKIEDIFYYLKKTKRIITTYIRVFFPFLYNSKFFIWKDFKKPNITFKRRFGLLDWIKGRIGNQQTFPYENLSEAYQSSEKMIKVLIFELEQLADAAWLCKDYRAHSIYSKAANELSNLFHYKEQIKYLKKAYK